MLASLARDFLPPPNPSPPWTFYQEVLSRSAFVYLYVTTLRFLKTGGKTYRPLLSSQKNIQSRLNTHTKAATGRPWTSTVDFLPNASWVLLFPCAELFPCTELFPCAKLSPLSLNPIVNTSQPNIQSGFWKHCTCRLWIYTSYMYILPPFFIFEAHTVRVMFVPTGKPNCFPLAAAGLAVLTK